MPERVSVRPEILTWAVRRARINEDDVARRFPKFDAWTRGEQPTFRQLETFATAMHAPFGFFFLSEPPREDVPIPDFRTVADAEIEVPSPDLLETIYACQMRQEWYREHALERELEALDIVGSATVAESPLLVADRIRHAIRFSVDERAAYPTHEESLRALIDLIEDTGVLVMVSGIVGGNTHRKLDPEEFRGFALSDPLAPVIFVNGADTKAAQIFTMIHELAHIYLGETALSDAAMARTADNAHERWCNAVAAEVLVPIATLATDYPNSVETTELERIAKRYRVSTLVVLRRLFDMNALEWDDYRQRYAAERERIMAILETRRAAGSGGNFYYTQPLRISRRFARAVIVDALEGGTLYRDAYGLLGTSKRETFDNLATELGVA